MKTLYFMQQKPSKRSDGFSTLPIIMILLFMITALIMYTSMISINEQKISSNTTLALEAIDNADIGLDRTMVKLRINAFRQANLVDADGNGCLDTGTVDPNDATACIANSVLVGDSVPAGIVSNPVYSFGTTAINPLRNNFDELVMESVGCTDACDCRSIATGNRKECRIHKAVRESAVLMKPLTPVPTTEAPLVVLKNITLGGNIRIDNNQDGFAITAGDTLTFTDTLPQLTRLVATESPTIQPAPPAVGGTPQLSITQIVADSGIAPNPNSNGINAFFLRFIGNGFATTQTQTNQINSTKNIIQRLASSITCTPSCSDADLIAATATNQVVTINGTLILSGNTAWGNPNPLLLIVNGDLQITGNTSINGLVYVNPTAAGNTWSAPSAGGALTINGRLVVQGSLNSPVGGLTIQNSNIIDSALNQLSYIENIPDSWEELYN